MALYKGYKIETREATPEDIMEAKSSMAPGDRSVNMGVVAFATLVVPEEYQCGLRVSCTKGKGLLCFAGMGSNPRHVSRFKSMDEARAAAIKGLEQVITDHLEGARQHYTFS